MKIKYMPVLQSVLIISFSVISLSSCNIDKNNTSFSDLSGPYLGQTPPVKDAKLFAPGLISTAMYTRDIAITPDGKEIYFCVSAMGYNLIFFTKETNGCWSEAMIAPFITDLKNTYYEPHITADGKKLFFFSYMTFNENEEANQDIWVVDREGDSWESPYNLGAPINTDGSEFFPSTTKDGTLYFSRSEKGSRTHYIYRSKYRNGKYLEPERLPENVNCGTNRFNAFIDPDERFIIVPAIGMEDGLGGVDYYISFRNKDDKWSQPINLGPTINQTSGAEWSPYISPDGKYFFFMSSRSNTFKAKNENTTHYQYLLNASSTPANGNSSIYWIKSDFINELNKIAKY